MVNWLMFVAGLAALVIGADVLVRSSTAKQTWPWAMSWAATPSTSWDIWGCPVSGLAVALATLALFLSGRKIARWEGVFSWGATRPTSLT